MNLILYNIIQNMCDTSNIFFEGLEGGDTIALNNVLVEGDVVNFDTDALTYGGNYIILNREHTDPVGENGGLVLNYLPTAVQDDVVTIISLTSFETTGAGTFATGDIIVINNANSPANDGLYCVASHIGTTVTIEASPGSTADFCRTSFTETGPPETPTTATKVNVSTLRANTSGNWEIGKNSAGPLDYSVIQPAGNIIMWSGAIGAIPNGWTLCDGTNGTPDLRDRFVVCAGGIYSVGATGGANGHTLIEAEVPVRDHVHEYSRTDSVTINEVARLFAEETSFGILPAGFFGTIPTVPIPDIPAVNIPGVDLDPLPDIPGVDIPGVPFPDIPSFSIPPTSVGFAPGSGFIWQDLIWTLVPEQGSGTAFPHPPGSSAPDISPGTNMTNNEVVTDTSNPTTSPVADPHENRPPFYALAFIQKLPL